MIHDFNERPGHWVHPERLQKIPNGSLVQTLLNEGAAQTGLHRWLIRQLGLATVPGCWDFEDPRRRLALLSHETLAKLAVFCGAAYCWKRIANIIGGAALKELKAEIGPEAHVFALRKGRQLMEAYEGPDSQIQSDNLKDDIHSFGWRTVTRVFAGEPDPLMQRLRLKLPPHEAVEACLQIEAGDEAVREAAWKWTRRVMADVLNRKELQCFV